jgi:hypothetical protein
MSRPSKAAIAERFFLTLFFLLTSALGIAWFTQRPPEFQTLRFTIDAPRGTTFSDPFRGTAISPDGHTLVFTAARTGGDSTLWLRPLDSLEARELPGTEGSDGPFWSPDSKSIGFFANGKLKRLDVSAGTPQVLCDAATEQGGTWNQDGVILFSAGNIVQRVAAAGGLAAPVTTLDASRGETSHRFPQFLPDGRSFLYSSQSSSCRSVPGAAADCTDPVYAATLDRSQPARVLVASEHQAVYAAPHAGRPGQLMWLSGRRLLAQKLDLDLLRLEGQPAAIAEDAALTDPNERAPFWVSANGVLVYRTSPDASAPLTVVTNWQTLLKK